MAKVVINNSKPHSDIRKLKGCENYQDWQMDMRTLLIFEQYWICIEGYPEGDKTSDVQRASKERKTRALLFLMVEPCVKPYISLTTSAKEAWTALERAYGDGGANRGINLRFTYIQEMCSVKLKDFCNMQEYVDAFNSIALKVSAIGKPVDDDILSVLLLKGLTNDYLLMIESLQNSKIEISSDYVKTILLQGEKSEENGSDNSSNNVTHFPKGNDNNNFNNNVIQLSKDSSNNSSNNVVPWSPNVNCSNNSNDTVAKLSESNGNNNSNNDVAKLSKQRPKRKRTKKKKPRCWVCGELGHVLQNCPTRETSSRSTSISKTEKKIENSGSIVIASNKWYVKSGVLNYM